MFKRRPIPACSHRVAYSYLWPTVMNMFFFLSMVKSLHSTLYTVRVQVSHRAKLKMMFSSKDLQPKVKEHFQRGASIAWCFHPAHKKKQRNEKMPARQQEWKRCVGDIQLTFWQQSMNSSMVTTPSLFLSIFCWETERGKDGKQMRRRYSEASLPWTDIYRTVNACLKEYFYMLTRRLLFEDRVSAFPHHVVDGLHDVEHFLWRAEKGVSSPKLQQQKKRKKGLSLVGRKADHFGYMCLSLSEVSAATPI